MAPSDLSIGQLAERTGVAVDTLRAWERRYGVIAPTRTDGGHRRYGLESVERVRWLLERVEAGQRVGAAAAALETALPSGHVRPEHLQRQTLVRAAEAGDIATLNATMDAVFAGLPLIEALELTVFPALTELGTLWEERGTAIAAEHLLTEATARRLAERLTATAATGGTPCIVFCPANEWHALGALALAALLSADGWDVAYLGASAPIKEVAGMAERRHARLAIAVCTRAAVATATRRAMRAHANVDWVLAGPAFQGATASPNGVAVWSGGLGEARVAASQARTMEV